MNVAIITGRLTQDPDIRYNQDGMGVAHYTIAVNGFKAGEVDFIRCVSFKNQAEFIEKYVQKGTKLNIIGRIQTGSYENKEGIKVNTFDILTSSVEFAESKKNSEPEEKTPANRYNKYNR